jgi:hypothetical protein
MEREQIVMISHRGKEEENVMDGLAIASRRPKKKKKTQSQDPDSLFHRSVKPSTTLSMCSSLTCSPD